MYMFKTTTLYKNYKQQYYKITKKAAPAPKPALDTIALKLYKLKHWK